MRRNNRTRQTSSRRGRTYLDPHFFTAPTRRRPPQVRKSQKAMVSWVSYPVTIDEALADLTHGRD